MLKKAAISTGLGMIAGGVFKSCYACLVEMLKNIADAVRKNLEEAPSTQNVKVKTLQKETDVVDPSEPVRHNITERLAELNTKVGRFFNSNVTLPREVFNAAIKKERGSNVGLSIKASLKKLQKEINTDRLERIKK